MHTVAYDLCMILSQQSGRVVTQRVKCKGRAHLVAMHRKRIEGSRQRHCNELHCLHRQDGLPSRDCSSDDSKPISCLK